LYDPDKYITGEILCQMNIAYPPVDIGIDTSSIAVVEFPQCCLIVLFCTF
jgi:hypothetical protein